MHALSPWRILRNWRSELPIGAAPQSEGQNVLCASWKRDTDTNIQGLAPANEDPHDIHSTNFVVFYIRLETLKTIKQAPQRTQVQRARQARNCNSNNITSADSKLCPTSTKGASLTGHRAALDFVFRVYGLQLKLYSPIGNACMHAGECKFSST